MKRLRFLSAQPAIDYYSWQVEVYIHNFISLGYKENHIDIVAGYQEDIPESWINLQKRFPKARFFFYEDTTYSYVENSARGLLWLKWITIKPK